jgi:manganese/zinc/iron transport system permease protein
MICLPTFDYTLVLMIATTALIGALAGVLGCFAYVRGQSLLGDAIAHASWPGIALMFLLTASKNSYLLLLGGFGTGMIGILLVRLIHERTTLKQDTILAIVLSVFFGIGLVLVTIIQKYPLGQQSILNKFLFGNATALLVQELYLILGVAMVIFFILFFLYKEFNLFVFDKTYCSTLGFNTVFLDVLLCTILVVTIVIGLQIVGVILMSSMLIAPSVAARRWSIGFKAMIRYAVIIGSGCAISGSLASSMIAHMPTGPAIIIITSVVVFISLLVT